MLSFQNRFTILYQRKIFNYFREGIKMSLKISSDFSAMATNTLSQLHKHQSAMGKSIERVSTGYKINSAEDGALKYYLANKFDMKAEEQETTNESMQVGAGFLNTADRALNSILNTLRQMREGALAVANGAVSAGTAEYSQVATAYANGVSDIQNFISNTKFNGTQVLRTDTDATATVLVDATNGWAIKFSITAASLQQATGLNSANDIRTAQLASDALKSGGALYNAIDAITALQGNIANSLARVNQATTYLEDIREVNINSRDTIKNADMAKEMTEYVKQNVLAQASQAMLSQANSGLASVLNLLS
jgi:flagellin